MTQARLRLIIFIAWASFLGVSLVASLAAPQLRSDATLTDGVEMPFEAILGLYLPAIGCLAGFWFPTDERKVGASRRVPRDRSIAALVLTFGYLAGSFLLVFHAIYVWDYSVGGAEVPVGATFAERVSRMIGIAGALSGPALLPIAFLTRTPPAEPSATPAKPD